MLDLYHFFASSLFSSRLRVVSVHFRSHILCIRQASVCGVSALRGLDYYKCKSVLHHHLSLFRLL